MDKSKKIRRDAIEQLRKTRAKLLEEHPLLMKKMAILAKRHAPPMEPDTSPIKTQQSVKRTEKSVMTDETQVDKQKNIRAIQKFLDSKDDETAVDSAIKAMLAKHKQH